MKQGYPSFAKINLFLYVLSRRADGYHTLYSLMTRIDLHDDLHLDFSQKKITVSCDHPDVPSDESNIAWKAAALFFRSLEKEGGVSIEIVKRIPPGGGLGGGSSNAATVLTALNRAYQNPFSKPDLMKLGLTLGADVPFFMLNETSAIAQGVGERLEKVANLKPYHLVLCNPGVAASTALVYKNIDFELTTNRKYTKNTGLNVPLRGQEIDIRGLAHNDLEASAFRLYPEIRETKEEMELLLHRQVCMTGSGSSLFALFSAREKAEKGGELLREKWTGSRKQIFLSSFN